ncbi:MAG: phosphoribosylamine--glycine ligase [Actinomycetota bacterium]|nr:phosphoribosylamine--glycine ligase [Actinomycetota bacterium]
MIIGKDARTDALLTVCSQSPQHPRLFGLAEMLVPGWAHKCEEVFTGSLVDVDLVKQIAKRVRPDLVIIGPEEPLAAGYADALASCGLPVFGPSRTLARIESSKSWARELVDRYDIPGNPEYRVFDTVRDVQRYMEDLGEFVVKPDGLTGGKGVQVFGEHLHSIEEAVAYVATVLDKEHKVQIEERLKGEEFSLQTITDGETVIHCPLVQDHKRAFEGDEGPNTGGMGSYSFADFSLPFLEDADIRAAHSINERVIDALHRETGEPYKGVLYGGFMATSRGLRLIEYNARFGDPEALNVLPLLDADFVELCMATARSELARVDYAFQSRATVCKYMVPAAYPQGSPSGVRIESPSDDALDEDLRWFWAACMEDGEGVALTSSRSGAFVGVGDSVAEAYAVAERAAVELEQRNLGKIRHRPDVGRADIIAKRIAHMNSLRAVPAASGARHR